MKKKINNKGMLIILRTRDPGNDGNKFSGCRETLKNIRLQRSGIKSKEILIFFQSGIFLPIKSFIRGLHL